jgi:hypothetical protein
VPQPKSVYDATRAFMLLSDLGDLLEGANEVQQRAALRYVFRTFWLEAHRIKAITPTDLYAPMLAAVETMRGVDGEMGCLTGDRDTLATSIASVHLWRRDRSALEG